MEENNFLIMCCCFTLLENMTEKSHVFTDVFFILSWYSSLNFML